MFRGLLRPGQGFRPFTVLRRIGGTTAAGRPTTVRLEKQGEFYGIISRASQREMELAKQNGHPVTHRIVQRGIGNIRPTDVLELETPQGTVRRFLVQTVHNPAELGHFTSYLAEERGDLQ